MIWLMSVPNISSLGEGRFPNIFRIFVRRRSNGIHFDYNVSIVIAGYAVIQSTINSRYFVHFMYFHTVPNIRRWANL